MLPRLRVVPQTWSKTGLSQLPRHVALELKHAACVDACPKDAASAPGCPERCDVLRGGRGGCSWLPSTYLQAGALVIRSGDAAHRFATDWAGNYSSAMATASSTPGDYGFGNDQPALEAALEANCAARDFGRWRLGYLPPALNARFVRNTAKAVSQRGGIVLRGHLYVLHRATLKRVRTSPHLRFQGS